MSASPILSTRKGGRTLRANKATRLFCGLGKRSTLLPLSRPHCSVRIGGTDMKFPHRRQFFYLAAGAAALSAGATIARAQAYPTRPVRIIVNSAPGGAPDILARLMGQWLSERLGQPFVIDNRPGAGGNIAIEAVVKAPA